MIPISYIVETLCTALSESKGSYKDALIKMCGFLIGNALLRMCFAAGTFSAGSKLLLKLAPAEIVLNIKENLLLVNIQFNPN